MLTNRKNSNQHHQFIMTKGVPCRLRNGSKYDRNHSHDGPSYFTRGMIKKIGASSLIVFNFATIIALHQQKPIAKPIPEVVDFPINRNLRTLDIIYGRNSSVDFDDDDDDSVVAQENNLEQSPPRQDAVPALKNKAEPPVPLSLRISVPSEGNPELQILPQSETGAAPEVNTERPPPTSEAGGALALEGHHEQPLRFPPNGGVVPEANSEQPPLMPDISAISPMENYQRSPPLIEADTTVPAVNLERPPPAPPKTGAVLGEILEQPSPPPPRPEVTAALEVINPEQPPPQIEVATLPIRNS